MKLLVLALVLALSLSAGALAQSQTNTVSLSILPGPFTYGLTREAGVIVLNVDDSTGSALGWWITVDCTCTVVPAGNPLTIAGQALDPAGGPRLVGRTLIAEPAHGMGS